MKHDTVTVHTFQTVVLKYLKERIPDLKKVIYFSDGAASQYKNFKNFANLLHHSSDYGLDAEWNFFGTSHGKNTCDGIGGTVKRLAARASLQRTLDDHIMTPLQLFDWCRKNIKGTTCFLFLQLSLLKNHRCLLNASSSIKLFLAPEKTTSLFRCLTVNSRWPEYLEILTTLLSTQQHIPTCQLSLRQS